MPMYSYSQITRDHTNIMTSKLCKVVANFWIALSVLVAGCNSNGNQIESSQKRVNYGGFANISTHNASVSNETSTINPAEQRFSQKYFLTSVYAMVLVVGVPGNALLVFAISTIKRNKASKSLFLVNLAVGDLVNLLVCIPIVITGMYVSWPFGPFVCKFLFPLADVSIANNVFTLLAISVERYHIIARPMTRTIKAKWVAITSILLWTLSYCVVAIPLAFALKIADGLWVEKSCDVKWISKAHEISYRLVIFFIQFVVPFSVMAICFKKMQGRLKTNTSFATTSMDLLSAERRVQQNYRLVRMLLVVVVCFVTCFLPLHVLVLAICFYPNILFWPQIGMLAQLFFVLLLCQSIVNPVTLFIMGKEIRQAAVCFCKSKARKEKIGKSGFYFKSQADTELVATPIPYQKDKFFAECLLSDLH